MFICLAFKNERQIRSQFKLKLFIDAWMVDLFNQQSAQNSSECRDMLHAKYVKIDYISYRVNSTLAKS